MAKNFGGAPPLELLLFLACPIENSKKKFCGGGGSAPPMYGRTAYGAQYLYRPDSAL